MRAWAEVRKTGQIDLFVGLFMNSGNNGLSVSPTHLLVLGERGIELDLDVYDQSEDQPSDRDVSAFDPQQTSSRVYG